jgi:hypothetical protein
LGTTIYATVIGMLVRGLNEGVYRDLCNVEIYFAKIESGSTFGIILDVGEGLDVLTRQAVVVVGADRCGS